LFNRNHGKCGNKMTLENELGNYTEIIQEVYKQPSISPFDFLKSINETKINLIVDEWSERQYQPYIVNKGLSFAPDSVIFANEMNSRPHLEKSLQNNFLINTIRSKKRFSKWIKPQKLEAIEIIKDYYGYSTEKARQVVSIFTEKQLENLKEKLKKGGMNDG